MNNRNEKISAYLDGEIHQDELMSFSLSGESEDAKTSMHYQYIGDALRGEASELSTLDVSAAVREALADEDISDQMATVQRQVKSSENTGSAGGLLSWFSLRPLGGMAIAATVAGVMVFSVTQQEQSTSSGQLAGAVPDINQSVPVAIVQRPLSAQLAAAPVAPTQSVPASNTVELNPYLNEHFATQGALQSRMPYVRAVSYESKK